MVSPTSATPSTAELPVSQPKDEVIKEAKRIEEDTLYSSKGHFVAAQFWSNFHLWVGVPTALFAGIAAASAFSQFHNSGVVAGIISVAVGGLTALSTFINPNERAGTHLNAGNNYDALMNRARIFRTIDCWYESDEVLTSKLKDLSNEKDKLNRSCPQIPRWAYRAAKRGILAGEAVHSVDKEG